MASRVFTCFGLFASALLLLLLAIAPISTAEGEAEQTEYVLTLDHSNFSDVVSKHGFIVVEFYAPWCGHCKHLAPQYEKAANALRSHDPPVVLAKFDASEESNKELASKFEVRGFPTLKILRDGGKSVQEFKGPRDADGIVSYLRKQAGPASAEIKSVEDASNLIDEKKIFIAGIFPKFVGEEYENFTVLAERFRSDYDFGHTLEAKLLPRGESSVSGPVVRLLKPFDEQFIDFQDFHVDTLEKLVEEASLPVVTIFNKDESNQPFLVKFFNNPNAKVMLFANFSNELGDGFNSKFREAALLYKGQGLIFLQGDIDSSQNFFQYFGLKVDQAPLILVQNNDGKKFLKPNLEPEHIAPWLKEYMDGLVKPFLKSEAIPETNNDPVKVVVANNLEDIVFNSGKNVLIEFYAPWCGHCQKLAPILEEVATSFVNDPDVVIAKLDATANDIPEAALEVVGYPTVYFRSASGNISKYEGGRSKEDIIKYINQNRGSKSEEPQESPPSKDEL